MRKTNGQSVIRGITIAFMLGATLTANTRPTHAQSIAISPIMSTVSVAGANAIATDENTGRVFVAGNAVATILDAHSGHPLTTAPIGTGPYTFAIDDRAKHVFVISGSDNRTLPGVQGSDTFHISVTTLDAATGAEINAIAIPAGGFLRSNVGIDNVGIDAETSRLFIFSTLTPGQTEYPQVLMTVIDTHTGAILSTRHIKDQFEGQGLTSLIINHRTGRGFVFGDHQAFWYEFDATTGAQVGTLPRDRTVELFRAVMDERHNRIVAIGYVCTPTCQSAVVLIDGTTGRVMHTSIVFGMDIQFASVIGLDQNSGRAFIANNPEGIIVVNDETGRVVITRAIPGGSELAIDSRSQRAYAVTVLPATQGQTVPANQQLLTIVDPGTWTVKGGTYRW